MEGIVGDGSDAVSEECSNAIIAVLEAASVLTEDGALDLTIEHDEIGLVLDKGLAESSRDEYTGKRDNVIAIILRSRYRNLYSLLRDNVSAATLLGIVRNQILVDIQGDDLLYQIFTANILQRNAGEEAPFFEFIQRVCSECVIKPGCGGFGTYRSWLCLLFDVTGKSSHLKQNNRVPPSGIRNFLTLFLSIEVSKAMQEVVDARSVGDLGRQQYAEKMVDYFTEQLNEANPILTEISEAMTEEGRCLEKLNAALAFENSEDADTWRGKIEEAATRKSIGNARLMECSARYNDLMKNLRESRCRV